MNTSQRIEQARVRIDSYPSVCLMMTPNHRGAFASAIVLAFEAELARAPEEKPSLELVKARMKESPELKGFVIPVWILTAVFSWIIQQILDWLWDNR